MSRKEDIFDSLYQTKDYIVNDFLVDDDDNIEEEESEVTVMEIDVERSPYCVFRQPFWNGGSWLAEFRKSEKGALDLIFAWFVLKWDINADLWIHTWEHKQQKGII